jgi:hypothetical protein
MLTRNPVSSQPSADPSVLKFLRPEVIAVIEEALNKVGPFGEVHLIIERGHLRFIRTIKSEAVDRARTDA